MTFPCFHPDGSSASSSSNSMTLSSADEGGVDSRRSSMEVEDNTRERSSSNCICHLVVPPPTTPHESAMECRLCHRNLFQTALENAMDALDILNEKLVAQKNACELLQADNDSLHDENVALHRELELLRKDNEVLAKKLISEAEQRSQLILENDMITLELNELTEKLFSEANNLVSTEARLRSEAETSKNRAMTELEEAKKQLLIEQQQLTEFKEKIEEYAAREEDFGHYVHSDALFMDTSDESLPPSPRGGGEDGFECDPHQPRTNPRKVFDARLYVEFNEFLDEVKQKNIKISSLYFMKRCMEEDIEPCLRFMGRMSFRRLLEAFQDNSCFLELNPQACMDEMDSTAVCSTCDCKRRCMYRYRLREAEPWKPIDRFCRDRIVAVGDFYAFVRHLQLGLFRSASTQDLFHECSRLRRQVFYARVGALHLFPVKQRYFLGFAQSQSFRERDTLELEISPPSPDSEEAQEELPLQQPAYSTSNSNGSNLELPYVARVATPRSPSPLRMVSSGSPSLRRTSSGNPRRALRRSFTLDDEETIRRSDSLTNVDSSFRRMSSKFESALESLSSSSGGSISISINNLFSKKNGNSLFKNLHQKDLSQVELDLELESSAM